MNNIIFYELNEVPLQVLNRFVKLYPNSAFASLSKSSNVYETVNNDIGHLSPWITWPTLHRGVNNSIHNISDFGQNLSTINKLYPNFFNKAGTTSALYLSFKRGEYFII